MSMFLGCLDDLAAVTFVSYEFASLIVMSFYSELLLPGLLLIYEYKISGLFLTLLTWYRTLWLLSKAGFASRLAL